MTLNIMMISNFPSSTGYAWKMINSCFEAIGEHFIINNNMAFICYPKIDSDIQHLTNKGIKAIEYDLWNSSFISNCNFVKTKNISIVYLIDKPTISVKYFFMRLAGVRWILVHDHTSGERTPPKGIKKILKYIFNNIRLFSADIVIAISDYVRSRHLKNSFVPERKLFTIYNGLDLSEYNDNKNTDIRKQYNIHNNKKIIYCCGRSNKYKGIHIFIKAADLLINTRKKGDLVFAYSGDGPDIQYFRDMVSQLKLDDHFIFTGYVASVHEFMKEAHVCVVPSIWQEGFGLVVIEAMASGVPVIVSKVGGMAEILEDGVDGFYFEQGDYNKIADIIETLIKDDTLRGNIVISARNKIINKYNIHNQTEKIIDIIKKLE